MTYTKVDRIGRKLVAIQRAQMILVYQCSIVGKGARHEYTKALSQLFVTASPTRCRLFCFQMDIEEKGTEWGPVTSHEPKFHDDVHNRADFGAPKAAKTTKNTLEKENARLMRINKVGRPESR